MYCDNPASGAPPATPIVLTALLLAALPARATAQQENDDAFLRVTVPEEGEDRIHRLRTQGRHTTVIVLPPGENILDFVAGDSEYWHLTGAANVAFLKPLASDAATDDTRAVFVYAEPGHETSTALRSWGGAHRGLWHALQRQGRSVEIVAVVRTRKEMDGAGTILGNWVEAPAASGAVDPARREIVRIEQAIRAKDERVLKEYGDLQACLKRIVELNDLHRSSSPGTLIHGFATWRSRRLPGGGF